MEAVSTERTKRVFLKNNHSEDYEQEVHGEQVFIGAGKKINVPRRRAIEIRGKYAQNKDGESVECCLEMIPIPDDTTPEPEAPEASVDLLKRVTELEELVTKEPVKIYACSECDKEYENKDALKRHLKTHGGSNGRHDSSSATGKRS